MSQQLINHSKDLKKLRDEGFAIQVKGGYLVIHHIPYVNTQKEVKRGILVSQLNLVNNSTTAKPNTHVMFFIGDQPCDKDGNIITAIQHGVGEQKLLDGFTVNRSFSNKPANGYADFYEKVTTYARIITAPAKSLDASLTEKTFDVIADDDAETVFSYVDTNSSRANVAHINSKFLEQRIAIIGMGGTGAYILDLVAKAPVKDIHTYDGDEFLQHNAFRSPGAASLEHLNKKMKKVSYYAEMYLKLHKGIKEHAYYITDTNLTELDAMSYVFICVDNDVARRMIIQHLLKVKIPFIDVGLGVNIANEQLVGTIRVTTGTVHKNDHLSNRISFEEDENNEYSTNVQIADLNCLNAVMAVMKWKKLSGFYQDLREEHHSSYSINVAQLQNEDTTA
ncbi:ThiF family adenylyltransferase [Segetibacter koreensis]|uniref:ThiF family adenylyltransferase n=1 Tax=Segetibacter koreensis TaxID=398037 RepID=UPI00037AE4B8|nr:ThiF family adenylyltransferase [Segetibacter koreensis]